LAPPLENTHWKEQLMNPNFVSMVLLLVLACPLAVAAANPGQALRAGSYVPGELLVKYKESEGERVRARLQANGMTKVKDLKQLRVQRYKLPASMSVQEGMALLSQDPSVEYVEPNYIRKALAAPNDPLFGLQWSLENTGQSVNGITGIQGADIAWVRAREITPGGEVLIAVLDSGVDANHPDIADVIWENPDEVEDGNDTDGNGFVDDVSGWDFLDGDNLPMDSFGHGTAVAGIIAAPADNGSGMAGACPECRIVPVRFLNAFGEGSVADEIEAIRYAVAIGARVINASYGSPFFSESECDAIREAGEAGVLFIAAAGNSSRNASDYPAACDAENVVSVATSQQNDTLAPSSNFSRTLVDVAAPGINILAPVLKREVKQLFSFEAEEDGWTLTSPWQVSLEDAADGIYSLAAKIGALAGPVDASAISPPIDFTDKAGTVLNFKMKSSLFGNSRLYVETATHEAGPWTAVPVLAVQSSLGSWSENRADIGILDGTQSGFVRFRLSSFSANSTQEVYLDNLEFISAGGNLSYTGAFDDFEFASGTSFSTAVVSGVAGMLLSREQSLAPAASRIRIINTVDLLPGMRDRLVSGGRVNAHNVLTNRVNASGGGSAGGGCVVGNASAPGGEWLLVLAALLLSRRFGSRPQNGRWKKSRL
jgi:subtilisin family serine protease